MHRYFPSPAILTSGPADESSASAQELEPSAASAGALTTRLDALASARQTATRPPAIPNWPEPVRGAPNAFLRCALFAAVQGQQRQVFKKRTLLASTRNIEIRFQGVQLDQSDLDVWLQIVHLSRNQLPGLPVAFSAYSLLSALQRDRGKGQYVWLADSLARLGGALIELTFEGRHTFGEHLLSYYRDEATRQYVVLPTVEMCRLFQGGYSHVQWHQREQLRRKPLTLWLHGYLCSHALPYPIKVATLHRLSGSTTQNLRDFKLRLRGALEELAQVGALDGFEITGDGRLVIDRQDT